MRICKTHKICFCVSRTGIFYSTFVLLKSKIFISLQNIFTYYADILPDGAIDFGYFSISNMPKGGNPALAVNGNIIAVSGVIDTAVALWLDIFPTRGSSLKIRDSTVILERTCLDE